MSLRFIVSCSIALPLLLAHDQQCVSLLQAKFELVTHDAARDSDNDASTNATTQVGLTNYFPEQHLLVTGCAKCGSTSLYSLIYVEMFGILPLGYTSGPCIQNPLNEAWAGQMMYVTPEQAAITNAESTVFSFGLIRDPSERYVSAWKWKLACDIPCVRTDVENRQQTVQELLALAGNTSSVPCLSFSEFLDAMLSVKEQGKAQDLNVHFLPQNLNPAFQEIPLDKWDMIAPITCDSCAAVLAEHLGDKSPTIKKFPDLNNSTKKVCSDSFVESDVEKQKLALLAKDEYEMFGPYLHKYPA